MPNRFCCYTGTQKLFGLPSDEALENAHSALGVDYGASNDEVNGAYTKLYMAQQRKSKGDVEGSQMKKLNGHMEVVRKWRTGTVVDEKFPLDLKT